MLAHLNGAVRVWAHSMRQAGRDYLPNLRQGRQAHGIGLTGGGRAARDARQVRASRAGTVGRAAAVADARGRHLAPALGGNGFGALARLPSLKPSSEMPAAVSAQWACRSSASQLGQANLPLVRTCLLYESPAISSVARAKRSAADESWAISRVA